MPGAVIQAGDAAVGEAGSLSVSGSQPRGRPPSSRQLPSGLAAAGGSPHRVSSSNDGSESLALAFLAIST